MTKKFWMNSALVALMLITSVSATAQTQSKALQHQLEALEQLAVPVRQWAEGSAAKLEQMEKTVHAITRDVRENLQNVREGKIPQSEADTRAQQQIMPALRAEIAKLEQITPQARAILDPYLNRLQKVLELTDCELATGSKNDCSTLEQATNALGFMESRFQHTVKLRRQLLELLIEFTALNPENPDDLERFEEVEKAVDDIANRREYADWARLPPEYSPFNPINEAMVALSYFRQKDYANSLTWHLKFVAAREKADGKRHFNTALAYLNVALTYEKLDDYAQAMEWHQKVLIALGNEPMAYNNIANAYMQQGNYEKALEWYQNALSIGARAPGQEDSDTAISYDGLAKLYARQENYAQALEWSLKAVAVHERGAGKEALRTAESYNTLANIYEQQGDYEKAMPLYRKAYRAYASTFGLTDTDAKAIQASMKRNDQKRVQTDADQKHCADDVQNKECGGLEVKK